MKIEANDPTQSGLVLSDLPPLAPLSRNEIETLCLKAARGAGLSWGHAEEAGFAAGWLHARGIYGTAALLAHLTCAAGKPWGLVCPVTGPGRWHASGAEPICPVALGAALSDHCQLPEGALAQGLCIGPVSHPILVLPFLARVAGVLGHPVLMRFPDGEIRIGPAAVAGDTDRLAAIDEGSFTLLPASAVGQADYTPRYSCNDNILTALGDFAMRTTVPPSERSRADAGAGTSDND